MRNFRFEAVDERGTLRLVAAKFPEAIGPAHTREACAKFVTLYPV